MADDKKRDHLNDMLKEWAPIINMHASKMHKAGLPPHVTVEDLYSHGMHGLIDAFHKYDAKKGAQFKTHASNRIKGKMLDHIHSSGGVDNYHYKQAKKQAATSEAPTAPAVTEAPKTGNEE